MSCAATDAPRVLIADDQPDVLDALTLLFRPQGFLTETVQSPDALLGALDEQEFDVLLMDLNYARDTTSGREGLDLLSKVHAVDPLLPIVVMTGWATLDIAVEALRGGVRDFLQKPWDNERIVACVRRQAEERRAARSQLAREAHELDEAREIQQGLLPHALPAVPGWDIAAVCEPAAVVGGDTFDLIRIDRHHLGLGVGDVSGKGIPAALLASNLQAAVRSAAARARPPADLCAEVNRALCGSIAPGHFVTYFFGVLDTETGSLRYCNAGHPPPLLATPGGAVSRLESGGMILGVSEDAEYGEGSARLGPGDCLAVYTDGLTEARSPSGDEFGESRLHRALLRSPSGSSGRSLVCRVLAEVRAFSGEARDDDQSLLVLLRSGLSTATV